MHAKHFEMLEKILEQDALTPMEINDKERVWMLRYECLARYPYALPKLLTSVSWNNHVDVAQVRATSRRCCNAGRSLCAGRGARVAA